MERGKNDEEQKLISRWQKLNTYIVEPMAFSVGVISPPTILGWLALDLK